VIYRDLLFNYILFVDILFYFNVIPAVYHSRNLILKVINLAFAILSDKIRPSADSSMRMSARTLTAFLKQTTKVKAVISFVEYYPTQLDDRLSEMIIFM